MGKTTTHHDTIAKQIAHVYDDESLYLYDGRRHCATTMKEAIDAIDAARVASVKVSVTPVDELERRITLFTGNLSAACKRIADLEGFDKRLYAVERELQTGRKVEIVAEPHFEQRLRTLEQGLFSLVERLKRAFTF